MNWRVAGFGLICIGMGTNGLLSYGNWRSFGIGIAGGMIMLGSHWLLEGEK